MSICWLGIWIRTREIVFKTSRVRIEQAVLTISSDRVPGRLTSNQYDAFLFSETQTLLRHKKTKEKYFSFRLENLWLMNRTGLEPATTWFEVKYAIHCATGPRRRLKFARPTAPGDQCFRWMKMSGYEAPVWSSWSGFLALTETARVQIPVREYLNFEFFSFGWWYYFNSRHAKASWTKICCTF